MNDIRDIWTGRALAREHKISETAIRNAYQRDQLFRIKDGKHKGKYDMADERNIQGIQLILGNKQAGDKRPRTNKTKQKKENTVVLNVSNEEIKIDFDKQNLDDILDIGSLNLLKKREEIKEKRLKNKETRGDLVDRKNVAKIFNKLWSVDTSQFQTLGTKISPDIASICGVDDQVKIAKVRERIDKEIFKITSHCQRIMSEYLAKINAGTIKGEE